MKILIIDDDRISLSLISKILIKGGYKTLEANNAKEAIELLKASEPVNLIICDLIMPDMDGLEFLNYICKDSAFQNIPVIMCSSRGDRESVVKTIKLGAVDFTVKPVAASDLLEKIDNVLKAVIPVLVNPTEVIERLGIDRVTYNEFISNFYEHISSGLGEMEELVNAGNFEGLISIADSLTGGATNLGAERLSNILKEIYELAQKKDADEVKSILIALKRELNIFHEVCEL